LACTPTGPAALTYDECAAILSEVLDRRITYADPTPWHYWRRMRRRGMPTGMIAVPLGIYTAARFGLASGLTDDVERIVGRPPIDFATFAADHATVWQRPFDAQASVAGRHGRDAPRESTPG